MMANSCNKLQIVWTQANKITNKRIKKRVKIMYISERGEERVIKRMIEVLLLYSFGPQHSNDEIRIFLVRQFVEKMHLARVIYNKRMRDKGMQHLFCSILIHFNLTCIWPTNCNSNSYSTYIIDEMRLATFIHSNHFKRREKMKIRKYEYIFSTLSIDFSATVVNVKQRTN